VNKDCHRSKANSVDQFTCRSVEDFIEGERK